MIVVRTRDSRVFEEAYFVMRRDPSPPSINEEDMLWEANRILENALPAAGRRAFPPREERGGQRLRGLFWFGMGLLSGGGISGLLWWIL